MSEQMQRLLSRLSEDLKQLDAACEHADEVYIAMLDKDDSEAPILRAVLTHLKDARAALERAKGTTP
jgi:hypothetical protein